MNAKFLWVAAALLLAGYAVLTWLSASAGVSSEDAYSIMQVAGDRLHAGTFGQSRPPGHPFNEDWALPAFTWLGGSGGGTVAPALYSVYQFIGGLLCLAVFWLFLGERALSPSRRLLGTACLAFSPTFLIESADGEEFLWATACIIAVVLLLSRLAAGHLHRPLLGWTVVIVLAVICSGYRVEIGAMALGVTLVMLVFSDRNLRQKVGLLLLLMVLFCLLWLPLVLHHGANPPYQIDLGLKARFELWAYKIVFCLLGILPMAFAAFFFLGWQRRFRLFPPFDREAIVYWTPRLAIAFFLLFLLYPLKQAVLLPALTFLIAWGVMQARSWAWTGFVIGCVMIQLTHFDCFENRVWTGPHAAPSLWSQFYEKKPLFQSPAVVAATQAAQEGRRVVISDNFPWDFTWNREHGRWTVPAEPLDSYEGFIQSYRLDSGGIVGTRLMADRSGRLRKYVAQGYEIWIDEKLYREIFMRYDIVTPTPATGLIDDVPCRIVKLTP